MIFYSCAFWGEKSYSWKETRAFESLPWLIQCLIVKYTNAQSGLKMNGGFWQKNGHLNKQNCHRN